MNYRKLWWLPFFIVVACAKTSVLQKSASTTFSGNAENWATAYDKYRAAFDAWWSNKNKASGKETASAPLYLNLMLCHEDKMEDPLEPLLDAPIGFIGGDYPAIKDTIDQVAADPATVFTDPETLRWYNSGGIESPKSYTEMKDTDIPQCGAGSISTVRRVGPVVGGVPAMCPGGMIPCHLTGPGVPRSPGCCVRCFAPFCYAVYANGARCAGRNIVPMRWGWCSQRPAGAILGWSCPCR